MTDEAVISRRGFLAGTLAGGAGLWIDVWMPRPAAAQAMSPNAAGEGIPTVLSPHERKQVEAMTSRILPTDDTPGALEAGCVRFIERALGLEDAAALPLYRAALGALERVCRERHGASFSQWDEAEQDALLHELEGGNVAGWDEPAALPDSFFATVRMHTLLAFVLDPKYGGNQDYVGWKTMGFPGPVHHLGGSRPDQMDGSRAFVPIWERVAPANGGKQTDRSGGTDHQRPVVPTEPE